MNLLSVQNKHRLALATLLKYNNDKFQVSKSLMFVYILLLAGSEKVLEKHFDGREKSWNFLSVKVWEPCTYYLLHSLRC